MSRSETNRRRFLKTAAATTVTAALGEYGSDTAHATEMLGPKASSQMRVKVVSRPEPATLPSPLYSFNREPLAPNSMAKLPLGSVRARGWLGHQLELMTNGMTGRLPEISSYLQPENGWFGSDKEGWEEQPYWFRGFYDLAVLTRDAKLQAESKRWIEAVLNSQDGGGYFGAKFHRCVVGQNGQKICDLWPHMVMLDALISHYENTRDERVIALLQKFFDFCRNLDDEMFISPLRDGFGDWKPGIQRDRAGDMIPHIIWLYNLTGDRGLLDLAARFYHQIEIPQGTFLDHHVINFTQRFAYPGVYSAISRQPWHYAQSEYWYSLHMSAWGQQPRGIFGADENIRFGYVDPRQGFETCGFGEFSKNFYELGRLTGDPTYADRVEDLLFNHFPAAQTPDLKALHYLTASNQPQLDASKNHEYDNKGRMINYSPHDYRCCQHNVAMTWPKFTENLWQATADGGLVAWMYAPNEVNAKVGRGGGEVKILVATDYPFKGEVNLQLTAHAPVRFPLYLRVPRWSEGFRVGLNGQQLATPAPAGKFVRIERSWQSGDRVRITMPMSVTMTRWPRTGSVTVDRGPLSYSVRIGERWNRCGGSDEWPEWEVFPTSPWNYGLVLDKAEARAAFRVSEKGQVSLQPWKLENAPIEIKVLAKRIPQWKLENETVAELQVSPVRSDQPSEEITLIPLGCARLRMACLPVIGEGPDAREWQTVPRLRRQ